MSDPSAFRAMIANTLADHPTWLEAALSGITEGMASAVRNAQRQAGGYMHAMHCALVLAGEKRVTAELRDMMSGQIAGAIRQHGDPCNKAERDFLAAQAGREG
jgi:hypothetical protein